MPLPNKDLPAGKLAFVELYGSTAVMNTYLKNRRRRPVWRLRALRSRLNSGCCPAMRHVQPWIIRISDVGRAEAVKLPILAEYQPQELEIKYFLADFVERHYGRMRATLRESYSRSLYFLERQLADSLIEANRKSQVVETFLVGNR